MAIAMVKAMPILSSGLAASPAQDAERSPSAEVEAVVVGAEGVGAGHGLLEVLDAAVDVELPGRHRVGRGVVAVGVDGVALGAVGRAHPMASSS
jgi:hypothetical protein